MCHLYFFFFVQAMSFPFYICMKECYISTSCVSIIMALRQAQWLVLMELWLCLGLLLLNVFSGSNASLCGWSCTWRRAANPAETQVYISASKLGFTCVLTSTYLPLLIISLFWAHRFQQQQATKKKKKPCVFIIFFLFFTSFSIPLGSVE